MSKNSPLFEIEHDAGIYTKSMKHLQYVPTKREKISPEICYNIEKYNKLVKEIKEKELPDDIRKFLLLAATRHIVFDYSQVAELYAQSDKEVQELMEKSGLVIIDIEDAMEYGYVDMTCTLRELRDEDAGL